MKKIKFILPALLMALTAMGCAPDAPEATTPNMDDFGNGGIVTDLGDTSMPGFDSTSEKEEPAEPSSSTTTTNKDDVDAGGPDFD